MTPCNLAEIAADMILKSTFSNVIGRHALMLSGDFPGFGINENTRFITVAVAGCQSC